MPDLTEDEAIALFEEIEEEASRLAASGRISLIWPIPEVAWDGRRVVGSIGELVLEYDHPDEVDHWAACRGRWRRSKGADFSVWCQYERMLRTGRNHFADRSGKAPYGWPEAFAGLVLEAAGFTCWTGAQLFRRPGRGAISSALKRANTETVLAGLDDSGYVSPRLLQDRVRFMPKNPDLVVYHAGRREWRFAEVKRDEKVQEAQIAGLALLHLGTQAPVAVIRLVPRGSRRRVRQHAFSFRYTVPATVSRP